MSFGLKQLEKANWLLMRLSQIQVTREELAKHGLTVIVGEDRHRGRDLKDMGLVTDRPLSEDAWTRIAQSVDVELLSVAQTAYNALVEMGIDVTGLEEPTPTISSN